MNGYSIPKATLGRLPLYLQYLRSLPESGTSTISATAIAKALSLGEVQVRKDLAVRENPRSDMRRQSLSLTLNAISDMKA